MNVDIFDKTLPPGNRVENIRKMLTGHHADLMRAQETMRDPAVAASFPPENYNSLMNSLIMAESKTSVALVYLGRPRE